MSSFISPYKEALLNICEKIDSASLSTWSLSCPNGLRNQENIDAWSNVRTEAFKLQSLGRVLKRSKSPQCKEIGQALRDEAKWIEDIIGHLIYKWEMLDLTSKTSSDGALVTQSCNEFSTLLQDFHFTYIDDLKSSALILMNKIEYLERYPSLENSYTTGLRAELKKLRTKIKREIDPTLLEDGTHKLRRLLRWAIMHFIYPQGHFSYKEAPKKTPAFLKLTPKKGAQPIDFKSLNFLSQSVTELGRIKDIGLHKHHLWNLSGRPTDINVSNVTTIDATKKIIRKFNKKDPLKILRKNLKQN